MNQEKMRGQCYSLRPGATTTKKDKKGKKDKKDKKTQESPQARKPEEQVGTNKSILITCYVFRGMRLPLQRQRKRIKQ